VIMDEGRPQEGRGGDVSEGLSTTAGACCSCAVEKHALGFFHLTDVQLLRLSSGFLNFRYPKFAHFSNWVFLDSHLCNLSLPSSSIQCW